MKTIRCAIYTRKSSDEGLEQGFNSLDAQREACGAYILSQASEGWTLVPELYDDGGYSGGTLERPALQRLLADVEAGRIDIIVVYKVDRLTRSLLDFSKLVEALDRSSVSFVSITQSFNTTTSMGRLTLNMLLSFAQFEREVTAERIRDKIAASKAKGMWMGGNPPLGYTPDGRTLAIDQQHVALIRQLFARYLQLGTVRKLAEELADQNILVPERIKPSGKIIGNVPFCRGQLYAILKNPIYAGDIPHKDKVYPGLHDAIIDRETWDRVQVMLKEKVAGTRTARSPHAALLAGLVVDQDGEPLISTHASKGRQRYRYYVSKALHHRTSDDGMRIPARELEDSVIQILAEPFADPLVLAGRAGIVLAASDMARHIRACEMLGGKIASRDKVLIATLINQVLVRTSSIEIRIDALALAEALGAELLEDAAPHIVLASPATLTRSGRALRLVETGGVRTSGKADPFLGKVVAKAHRWWGILREGEIGLQALANREGVTRSYMTRVVRLAFLSPEMVDDILAGRVPIQLTPKKLTATDAIAMDWGEQRKLLVAG